MFQLMNLQTLLLMLKDVQELISVQIYISVWLKNNEGIS